MVSEITEQHGRRERGLISLSLKRFLCDQQCLVLCVDLFENCKGIIES